MHSSHHPFPLPLSLTDGASSRSTAGDERDTDRVGAGGGWLRPARGLAGAPGGCGPLARELPRLGDVGDPGGCAPVPLRPPPGRLSRRTGVTGGVLVAITTAGQKRRRILLSSLLLEEVVALLHDHALVCAPANKCPLWRHSSIW